MRPMKQSNYRRRLDKPTDNSTFEELTYINLKNVSAEESNDFLKALKDISLTDDSFPENNRKQKR